MAAVARLLNAIFQRAMALGVLERLLSKLATVIGKTGKISITDLYHWIKANPGKLYRVLVETGNVLGLGWLLNEARKAFSDAPAEDAHRNAAEAWMNRITVVPSHEPTGYGPGPVALETASLSMQKQALEKVRLLMMAFGGSRAEAVSMVDALLNTTAEDFRTHREMRDLGLIDW